MVGVTWPVFSFDSAAAREGGNARKPGRRGRRPRISTVEGARKGVTGGLSRINAALGLGEKVQAIIRADVDLFVINRGFFGQQRCRYAVQVGEVCGEGRAPCFHCSSACAVPWNVCISLASSFGVIVMPALLLSS